MRPKYALISVFNKTGVADDARRLVKMGWKIISSGGTAKMLMEAKIPVINVAELVGGGAILGHRVVTLSREVHAGLLADPNKPEDLKELDSLVIPLIDLVRCDFYPLWAAITDPKATLASVIEKTDIGGPCMVRSGAKGLRIVVCKQENMEKVLQELEATGDVSIEHRQELRARAEYEVAKYIGQSAMFHGAGKFKVIAGEKVCEFKGENGPQTPAALFSTGSSDPLALENFKLIEGSAPSYNNWCDVDRLLQTMTHINAARELNIGFPPFVALGVKHGNACGAATADNVFDAVRNAIQGDTRAIFGGIVMTNFPITVDIATIMRASVPNEKALFDGVVAPEFSNDAIEILARKKGKCRLMANPALADCNFAFLDETPRLRQVRGGFMVQPNYNFVLNFLDPNMTMFGPRNFAAQNSLLLAWAVCATSNSNTITIVKDGMLIGNGVGQQDRVGAAKLAIKRAIDAGHGKKLEGAVACSDSFFPFPDGPKCLIQDGIKAIFSTSGSINDKEIQDLCVENGVTLYQMPDAEARGFFGH
jgi:phosphoribosylaminoimidazolecarboxamide formyltransferase/IMP cyclohydrolase